MKFLFIAVGTRGDIEPHLAIADMLKKRNHEVVCAFPEQFRELCEAHGFRFKSLGKEFIDLIHSDVGQQIMDGSVVRKLIALIKVLKMSVPIQRDLVSRQKRIVVEQALDRIIHNGKAIYPFLWNLQNPHKVVQISPVPYLIHPVDTHPNIGFGSKNLGSFLNRLTYKFGNAGIIQSIRMTPKWLGTSPQPTRAELRALLLSQPLIYTVSPALVKHQKAWPKNVKTLGYLERDKTVNWVPDTRLLSFLSTHNKVLALTFGSMTNRDSIGKTKLLLHILAKHNIPTIINQSAGGLTKPTEFNRSLFYFVDQIPYDWLFPKVYAVIHHGGSGTTHMASKSGCPSLIIPHIMDQFVWNSIIHQKQLGPKGISINKLTVANLEPLIAELWHNPSYKVNATHLAETMHGEDFDKEIYQTFTTNQ